MPKKACCCKQNCCDSFLFDEFITLFGTTMQTAAPVNKNDILILRMNRPGNQSAPTWQYYAIQGSPCSSGCAQNINV